MLKYIIVLVSFFLLASCSTVSAPSGKTSSWGVQATMIDAPTYGSGNHTVEYFADFQCSACIRFSHTFLPILEEFAASGKLIIVYKQFPLTTPHKNAYRDSIAALCSAEQGQYIPYKKVLIALEETKRGATVSDSERIEAVQWLSIDKSKFQSCLSSDTYASSVDRDVADGEAKRVNATPTVILDGTKLDFSIFRDENMFREQMGRILAH